MRYTTVMDLTDFPSIYRNINARLIYLHMALHAGYHDYDRDILRMSIRQIAATSGVSVSATRHALALLEKARLIKRNGDYWSVVKWFQEPTITQRKQQPYIVKQQTSSQSYTERERAARQERERMAAIDAERTARERAEREELLKQNKTTFMVYYEQQLELAKNGDPDAARIVERHREMYELHKRKFN